MTKVKNKRNAGLADKVHNKRKVESMKKKLNPFEVHINREKLKVLGKKSKHDRGIPGVSRAKAIKKRKETIGVELKQINKTNTFIDRRIGEKNTQLSAEDRMIARFAAERQKQHNKKNIFNLNDDGDDYYAEKLTHRGQTLEQIEKFDDPRSDEDEDEDDGRKISGGLRDEFVSEGHFGGGLLSKTDSKDGAKSHKDLIEQLIAESKIRKAEKQKLKEQTLDLTDKLDSEWKDLQPVVFKKMRKEDKEESAIEKLLSQAEKKGLDYDKMTRELRFEKRGTPSDGLKTDEKQAKEERARLEQLEREREMRMLGEVDAVKPKAKVPHRSAEDLEDNFELEDERDYMLSYDKDGKPLMPEHVLKDYSVPNAKPKFDDGISDTSESDDDDDEGEDDGDDSDVESDDEEDTKEELSGDDEEIPKNEQNNDKNSKNNSKDSSSDESDRESGSDIETNKQSAQKLNNKNKIKPETDSLPDIKRKKSEETHKNENVKVLQNEKTEELDEESKVNNDSLPESKRKKSEETHSKENGKVFQNGKTKELDKESGEEDEECDEEAEESSEEDEETEGNEIDFNNINDLKESDVESDNEVLEEDVEKIGSLFDLEASEGDKLKELLTGKTPSQQSTALQNLIKSYDPSLSEHNKDKLSRLFAHLLQYINDIFTDIKEESDVLIAFLIFDKLAPYFYDLAHTNKVSTKKYIVELLKEKYAIFKKRQRRIPDLDTLIFFKLIYLVYPTSDFRHPVTTPAIIFMSEILTYCKFNNAYSISRGLFVTTLILEYTTMSKRLVSPAINFLRGILYLSANTSVLNPIQVVPPFKLHRDMKLLNLDSDCSKMEVQTKMAAKDFVLNEIDDGFKIRCLLISMGILKEFFGYFNDIEAQYYLFEPHLKLLDRIDLDLYPKKVSKGVGGIVQYMKSSLEVKTFTPLCREKPRPKALRLYEPDIQDVFTGSKSSKLSREQADSQRLKSKYKKEMKGALREIRRDKSYIASVKMREKIQSDNMRKDKVKQIYKEASIQQGELNKIKRMK